MGRLSPDGAFLGFLSWYKARSTGHLKADRQGPPRPLLLETVPIPAVRFVVAIPVRRSEDKFPADDSLDHTESQYSSEPLSQLL